jgi:phosphonate transport system ATP-binding protein
MALLEIKNLSKFYKDVKALSNVSFSVKRGELVCVIGPSGSGKSTLLRCINRMIEPSAGYIVFDDRSVIGMNRHDLRKLRRRIGMIFQHYNLVYRLSVFENVLHGRLGYKSSIEGILGIYTEKEKEKAVKVIGKLGLDDQIYKRCDTLSGGQKQRVGIARALVQEPKMILCDEPIASLDPRSAKIIMDHLRDISHSMDITLLVNLHQVDVAAKYADRIIGLNQGRVVFEGKPDDLSKKQVYKIYGTEAGDLISD